MATVLVNEVVGTAWVVNADGSRTQIQQGMQIPENAEIITENGARVVLNADDAPALTIGENREFALAPEVFDTNLDAFGAAVDGSEPVDPDVARVLAALEEGGDIFDELEATAAVAGGTAGGGDGAGGSSFTRLMSIVEPTTPLALAYPSPVLDTPETQILGGTGADAAPADAPAVDTTVPDEVELEAPVVEPTPIPVEPDAPSDEPAPTPIDPEAPIDPETPVDPEVPVEPELPVIPEPETPTGPTPPPARPAVVTLTAPETMTEGEPYKITAGVDLPVVGSDLIITLDNGQTITIPVGGTTGEVTVDSPRGNDVYLQGDKPSQVGITTTEGGGYTSINTDSTATTTIKDDADPTKVTLTSTATVTEGEQIRVNATVEFPVTGSDLVITLDNGEKIIIPVNERTGFVEFDSREDDALVQGDGEKSVSIKEIAGGNYENIEYSQDPLTTVIHDNDAPAITVGNPSVTEGEVAVFAVDFGKPVDNDTRITFKLQYEEGLGKADDSDIDVSAIPVVEISGEAVTVTNNNDGTYSFTLPAHAYKEVTVAIQTQTDDDFEGKESFTLVVEQAGTTKNGANVDAKGQGIGEIVDSTNAPEVRINNITVTEGADEYAVFTVELDKASFEDISFDFGFGGTAQPTKDYDGLEVSTDNGATWVSTTTGTIPAESKELLVRTKIVNDEVQEGVEELSLLATVTNGTVFNKAASGTATIKDDDLLKVTVSDSAVQEDQPAEFTVRLDKAVEVDTTMTLSLAHGTTDNADFDFELPEVTFGGAAVAVTKNSNGTYSFNVPQGDFGDFTVKLPTKEDGTFEGSEGFTLTATLSGSLSDETSIKGELTATGDGTITDTNAAPEIRTQGGAEGNEDNDIKVTLSATDSDGTIESFTITDLPDNGVLWFEGEEVKANAVIAAVEGSAELTFKPTEDWSGKTEFSYTATDNGGETVTATYDIIVKPVMDELEATITIGDPENQVQTIDVSTINVDETDKSFTITAFNHNGDGNWKEMDDGISIIPFNGVGGEHVNGFGVKGKANPDNNSNDHDEIDSHEKIRIDFDHPATNVGVQFSWLAESSKELAEITVYGKDGEILGTYTQVGQTDKIDPLHSISEQFPGKEIKSIEFSAPDNNSDYVIHKVSYTTPTKSTYPLDISAQTGDTDGSEQITSVIVKVPAGAVLSHGTRVGEPDADGLVSYKLPLLSDEGYTVTKGAHGLNEIKIDGVKVTINTGDPLDVKLEVKAHETDSNGDPIEEESDTATDDAQIEGVEPFELNIGASWSQGDYIPESVGETKVNGGSGEENGFDLDANGQLIAIGSKVMVWYSAADENIWSAAKNSLNEARFRAYTKEKDGHHGNHGNGGQSQTDLRESTDIFIVGPSSTYQNDNNSGSLKGIKGTPGIASPDFILINGSSEDHPFNGNQGGGLSSDKPNQLHKWEFDKLGVEVDNVAGAIYSEVTGNTLTTVGGGDYFETTSLVPAQQEHTLNIEAKLSETNGSFDPNLTEIVITGLPENVAFSAEVDAVLQLNGTWKVTASGVEKAFSVVVTLPVGQKPEPVSVAATASDVKSGKEVSKEVREVDAEYGDAGERGESTLTTQGDEPQANPQMATLALDGVENEHSSENDNTDDNSISLLSDDDLLGDGYDTSIDAVATDSTGTAQTQKSDVETTVNDSYEEPREKPQDEDLISDQEQTVPNVAGISSPTESTKIVEESTKSTQKTEGVTNSFSEAGPSLDDIKTASDLVNNAGANADF